MVKIILEVIEMAVRTIPDNLSTWEKAMTDDFIKNKEKEQQEARKKLIDPPIAFEKLNISIKHPA